MDERNVMREMSFAFWGFVIGALLTFLLWTGADSHLVTVIPPVCK